MNTSSHSAPKKLLSIIFIFIILHFFVKQRYRNLILFIYIVQ